jgi:hypothetical protein
MVVVLTFVLLIFVFAGGPCAYLLYYFDKVKGGARALTPTSRAGDPKPFLLKPSFSGVSRSKFLLLFRVS